MVKKPSDGYSRSCTNTSVLDAANVDAKSISGSVGNIPKQQDFRIHGEALRTGLARSPARRAARKVWYEIKDLIKDMNKGKKFSYCERGLEISDETEMLRLGWYD